MRASLRPLFWTAAVVTTLALPATARAQHALDPVQVSARTAEADRLGARAARIQDGNSRRHWGKAAGLREKAAGLRAPEDPRGFTDLQVAALLRHALNQRTQAFGLMQRAGDQAMARGDVFNAATAYVDAAIIAAELRDGDRLRLYAEKGKLLMHSPLLNAGQRASLQRVLASDSAPAREVAAAMGVAATPAP